MDGGGLLSSGGALGRLIRAVEVFGFHLATLDLRQNSAIHESVVAEMLKVAGVCDDYTALGEPELDDSFLLIVNPHAEAVRFELPKSHLGRQWAVELSTAELSTAELEGELHAVAAAGLLYVEGRSLVVLRRIS